MLIIIGLNIERRNNAYLQTTKILLASEITEAASIKQMHLKRVIK